MIPILCEKQYYGSGGDYRIGQLSIWVDCLVTEERNGEFFLEGTLPIHAPLVDQLDIDRIILAAPAPGKPVQPFRIRKLYKDASGSAIKVTAHHVSYQLTENIVDPFFSYLTYTDIDALLSERATRTTPLLSGLFGFSSDIVLANGINPSPGKPESVRAWIGGEGGLLELLNGQGYDAEIEWDGWAVKINAVRGTETDLAIAYASNLDTLSLSKDAAGLVTGYYGYGTWSDTFKCAVGYRPNYSNFAHPRIEMVDFTDHFETLPTDSELQTAVNNYAADQGTPQLPTSITVTAVPDALQSVFLCDSVQVIHPDYQLNKKAKIVKTVYDPIRERYTAVTIGEIQKGITDTVARMLAGGNYAQLSVQP